MSDQDRYDAEVGCHAQRLDIAERERDELLRVLRDCLPALRYAAECEEAFDYCYSRALKALKAFDR